MIQEFYNLIDDEHFWDYPTKNFQAIFYLFSIYLNMASNQIDSWIFLLRYSYSRIYGLRVLRSFWLVAQEPELSQIWNLYRHSTFNTNLHFTIIPEISNDKIFEKTFKILIFGHFPPTFPFLGKKQIFSKKIGLSVFTFYNYLTIMQKSKNTNEQTAKKNPETDRQSDKESDRQTDRQTDRNADKETDRQTDKHYFKGPSVLSGSRKFNLKIIDRILNRPLNCGWKEQILRKVTI